MAAIATAEQFSNEALSRSPLARVYLSDFLSAWTRRDLEQALKRQAFNSLSGIWGPQIALAVLDEAPGDGKTREGGANVGISSSCSPPRSTDKEPQGAPPTLPTEQAGKGNGLHLKEGHPLPGQ